MKYQALLDKLPKGYTSPERDMISRAYKLAEKAHNGQTRISGDPYIFHSLTVASILAEMFVPPPVIAAALLHDTVEDTSLTLEEIERDFGIEITQLVDAVTKLASLRRVSRGDHAGTDKDTQDSDELVSGSTAGDGSKRKRVRTRQTDLASENLRKTFIAMADDPRVVLIKLADRLHNMRTLGYMPEEKQKRIAGETMDIFAPLANRLGIWQMKWELEDLGFRYVNPKKYKEIATNLAERRTNRENKLSKIIKRLHHILGQGGIRAEIDGRPKHIYSIYQKMVRKEVPFGMVHDVRGIRIVVPDKATCYTVLGIIHGNWRPIPGEFDDYIASPKDNFYRSLHTAVVYDDGKTVEVQIRTPEMHHNAEFGIAAHWRYKEGTKIDDNFDRRMVYLRQLMEWRQDVEDAQEFVASMKSDVFGDRVYAFTPRGDIIDLPSGATPIDFAYHVHTEVGHRCRGAKINGRLVSLDYTLKTGDMVEILTAKRGGPSRDWLNVNLGLVKTQRTRSKIRRWFKLQDREKNIANGKSIIDRELRHLNLDKVDMDSLAEKFDYRNLDDLMAAIGCGDLTIGRVVNELVFTEEEEDSDLPIISLSERDVSSTEDVTVLGLKGLLSHMGKCCNPTPGEEIIGYITRGRGATIHRQDCPNILRIKDIERLVQVSWGEPANTFPVPVQLKAYDRDGLMKDISTLLSDERINMNRVRVDVNHKNLAVFDLEIEVRDIEQLSRVLDRLERLSNVYEARRVRAG